MHTLLLWFREAQIAHLPLLTLPATPTHCPSCQHPQPYRWGTRTRTVQDLQGTLSSYKATAAVPVSTLRALPPTG